MQECVPVAPRHDVQAPKPSPWRQSARLADMAIAAALVLLLLPMIAFVAATAPRTAPGEPAWPGVRRFRGDQLHELFGVLRGEFSFFRATGRRLAFAD